MGPRAAPTPGRRRPPLVFANRYEAVAFWACAVGLLLVISLAALRWAVPRGTASLEARIAEQEREIQELRLELEAAQARLDSLGAP